MADPIKQEPVSEPAKAPIPVEPDAPSRPSMRECGDRIAKMEHELEELRIRFANVQTRGGGASVRN